MPRRPATGSELSLMFFHSMTPSETPGNFSAAYTQYLAENAGLQLQIKVSAFPLPGPLAGGMRRHVEMHDPPSVVSQNHKHVQDLKPDRRHGKDVNRHHGLD